MKVASAGSYVSLKIATGFGRIVRGRIFDLVARFSIHQFEHFSPASLITRTTNDTTQVHGVVISQCRPDPDDGARHLEKGTHPELLAAHGRYADLYHSQFNQSAYSA